MPFPAIDTVTTDRVLIRMVREADLADLLEINGDAQVTAFLPYETWSSLDDGRAWLQRMQALEGQETGRQFVLERRETGKVIGALLLFRFDEKSARAEIGYVLGRAYWKHGLMREALRAFCRDALDVAGLRRIEAEVNPANVASNAVLAQTGFTLEGRLRKRWVGKGGPYDSNFYGLLKEDLIASHSCAVE